VCAPVKTAQSESDDSQDSKVSSDGYVVRTSGHLVLVVFEWAIGSPLNFMEYRWMLDEDVIRVLGQWFARFHEISRQFSVSFPAISARIQQWSDIHEGVLRGAPVDPLDDAVAGDSSHYGVLHGDLNCSNYFFDDSSSTISVFDWDQTQRGWYLWDVAQAIFTVTMLSEAGLPISGTPVPEADPDKFMNSIVSAYESVSGLGTVDRERLMRMVTLRKVFYERFCRQAKAEGNVPPDMAAFIDYIVNWFEKK
jgi:Ser/Thr protein kinase RdoA (MazF antagonist)